MRQLIWKEWHEQSWKLAFGCIVLSAFAAIGLRTRIIPDEEMTMWVCFPAMGLLPLLAATGLIPAERSDGTLESLAALPVSMRQIFIVKTLTGIALCAGPLLGALLISLAVAGGREIESISMISLYLRSMVAAVVLFTWIYAFTVRLPTEARAAMVGIGVLLCWLMVSAWLEPEGLGDNRVIPFLASISPFTPVLESLTHLAGPGVLMNVLVQIAICTTLLFWASRSISKDVNSVG